MAEPKPRGTEKPWRRHLRTTREGKVFIFVTLGVGLAAFNTGNNLMFLILGFMLSLIVLSGIMSELVIQRIHVARRLPERVFAGDTCLVELSLHNRKQRVPSYSLEVEDLAVGLPTERRCYFLKVAPNAEQVAAYRRTPRRRGYLHLRGFRVATRYPFGIFENWRVLPIPGDMLVYPALLPEEPHPPEPRSQGVESPSYKLGVGTEIAGLRAYRDGDEARRIHWRRSAALSRIVVVERHRDASAQLTIALDNARPTDADERWDAGFELAVSQAATLAMSNHGQGLNVEVVCRGSRSPVVLSGAPLDPLLRFLALLEAVAAEDGLDFAEFDRDTEVVDVPVSPVQGAA